LRQRCVWPNPSGSSEDGFDVYFVSDCSAGVTQEAHDDAKVRMTMAEPNRSTEVAVINEWNPDYTAPERAALVGVFSQHGGPPRC